MDIERPAGPRTATLGRVHRLRRGRNYRPFVLLTLAIGIVAGFTAAVATGVAGRANSPTEATPVTIAASDLFPAVGPVYQTIDVYDPPSKGESDDGGGGGGGDE